MRVHWTDRAKQRLWKIHDHIAEDNPAAARDQVARLLASSRKLGELPHAGRRVPEYQLVDLRELLERPYRIIYLAYADRIDVISVMHYRQLLPTDIDDLLKGPA